MRVLERLTATDSDSVRVRCDLGFEGFSFQFFRRMMMLMVALGYGHELIYGNALYLSVLLDGISNRYTRIRYTLFMRCVGSCEKKYVNVFCASIQGDLFNVGYRIAYVVFTNDISNYPRSLFLFLPLEICYARVSTEWNMHKKILSPHTHIAFFFWIVLHNLLCSLDLIWFDDSCIFLVLLLGFVPDFLATKQSDEVTTSNQAAEAKWR